MSKTENLIVEIKMVFITACAIFKASAMAISVLGAWTGNWKTFFTGMVVMFLLNPCNVGKSFKSAILYHQISEMKLNDILEPYSINQRKHLCCVAIGFSVGLLLATCLAIRSGILACLYSKVIANGAGVSNSLLYLIPTGLFTFCRLVDYYESSLSSDSKKRKCKIKQLGMKKDSSRNNVKSKKVDNQIVIPMPKEFNIQDNQEFVVHKSKDGSIAIVPKTSSQYQSLSKLEPASDNEASEVEGMKEVKDKDS